MGDLRVPMSVIETAFGLPITVTRPNDTAIAATGTWLTALDDPQPFGTTYRKRDPRRVMSIARSAVDTMPIGTVVTAAEATGESTKTWKVDGLERVDIDEWRVILVAVAIP